MSKVMATNVVETIQNGVDGFQALLGSPKDYAQAVLMSGDALAEARAIGFTVEEIAEQANRSKSKVDRLFHFHAIYAQHKTDPALICRAVNLFGKGKTIELLKGLDNSADRREVLQGAIDEKNGVERTRRAARPKTPKAPNTPETPAEPASKMRDATIDDVIAWLLAARDTLTKDQAEKLDEASRVAAESAIHLRNNMTARKAS